MDRIAEQLDRIHKNLIIQKENKKVLNIEELSIFYNLKTGTIEKWVKKGILPHEVIDGQEYFHRDIVDAWLLGRVTTWQKPTNENVLLTELGEKVRKIDRRINKGVNSSPSTSNYGITIVWLQIFILLLLSIVFLSNK